MSNLAQELWRDELSGQRRSIPATDIGEHPGEDAPAKVSIERELRFFMPLSMLGDYLNVKNLEKITIEQHYFAPDNFPLISVFAGELAGVGLLPSDLRITQARIRTITKAHGEGETCLEIKGRQPHHDSFERLEFSVPITTDSFFRLRELAGAGSLTKSRYRAPGVISLNNRDQARVIAEIDVYDRIGKNQPLSSCSEKHDFATIDVEIPDKCLLGPLADGKHNLDFLFDAINLSDSEKRIQKSLSSQRMARKGLDKRAQDVLLELHEKYRAARE